MLRATIIFFLLLFLPLRANLGDTVAQCVARYGKPVGFSEASAKSPFGTVVFTAAGYTLVVFVAQNKEVGARVSKVDKSAFTDAEMQTVMNAESSTSPWTPTPSADPTCLQWKRADNATFLYDQQKHILILTSQDMVNALRLPQAKPAAPAPVTPHP